MFGGAVAASLTTTVVVGRNGVTSYDNQTGRKRWYRPTGRNRPWRADGQTLYVAESSDGYLGSSPVTALKVINLNTGTERTLGSPLGYPFSGTLAVADDGMVLFASASGVTAYSGSTGDLLWSMAGAVAEGTDPAADLIYLTSAGTTLTGVDPLTGQVKTSVSGSVANGAASMYVVRDGVALGLDRRRERRRLGVRRGGRPGHLDLGSAPLAALLLRPVRARRQRRHLRRRQRRGGRRLPAGHLGGRVRRPGAGRLHALGPGPRLGGSRPGDRVDRGV